VYGNKRVLAVVALLALAALVIGMLAAALVRSPALGRGPGDLPPQSLAAATLPAPGEPPEGAPMLLTADDGRPLLTTGLAIQAGDRFIDAGNDWWGVTSVQGGRALARRIAKLADHLEPDDGGADFRDAPGPTNPGAPLPERRRRRGPMPRHTPAGLTTGRPADVIIYHSHSDESYIPSDGTDSARDKGGIYAVGASLAAALQGQGLTVLQRPENHNPHDNSSYLRSRRTVLRSLAESNPGVLFDVHRDAAPASEYRYTAPDGQRLSRVMIVIGTANPGHEANLAFAQQIKARADSLHPGLVKGIFLGRGTYNQDTSTRNILLEAGSEQVPREEAQAGIARLGEAIAATLKEAAGAGSPAGRAEASAIWRSLAWYLGLGALIAAGWVLLINGGWRPALARLNEWLDQWRAPSKRR
jgi:stage II sporulation protein P